ncbi:MAG: metal-dependent hydrolase [archaeon]
MLFRTHLVFAVAIYFLLLKVMIVESPVLFFVGIVLGAALVDIDTSKSKMGKFWLFRPFQIFVRHRGFFHSVFVAFLFGLVLAYFWVYVGLGFFIGFISHLFLDSLTPAGVRPFWPFLKKKASFGFKTGGIFETVIFSLLLLLDIWFLFRLVF